MQNGLLLQIYNSEDFLRSDLVEKLVALENVPWKELCYEYFRKWQSTVHKMVTGCKCNSWESFVTCLAIIILWALYNCFSLVSEV